MLIKTVLGLAALAIAGVIYLVSIPNPIDAAAYQPHPSPELTGKLTPNNELKDAELLGLGWVLGPEDVDVDQHNVVYGANQDGRIVQVLTDGQIKEFANTGGRPLGLAFDAQQNLIVCDAIKGLLSIDPTGKISVLVTEVNATPLNFTDDLEIASDGMIYFSDASTKFGVAGYLMDLMESKPYGRLIRYDPNTKEAEQLLDGLYFANGVALSKNNDFVLVNETYRYRIKRLWLKGPKQGTTDLFIDNLPGFPDGISSTKRGTFWIAIPNLRSGFADSLHPYPWLKNQIAKLPLALLPKPKAYGLVIELDEQAKILRSLHDPDGKHLQEITSAQEHGGHLYFGSLHNDRIGQLKLE